MSRPTENHIVVDAACDQFTGVCEYKGLLFLSNVENPVVLFKMGLFNDGTNNIVEFLAVVHALAECERKGWNCPVYTDSVTAMAWVRDRRANTNKAMTPENIKLFELIFRAEKWLKKNHNHNKVMKWETKQWGENPADFGYKKWH